MDATIPHPAIGELERMGVEWRTILPQVAPELAAFIWMARWEEGVPIAMWLPNVPRAHIFVRIR